MSRAAAERRQAELLKRKRMRDAMVKPKPAVKKAAAKKMAAVRRSMG
jgi:hypothetical protein